MRLRQGGHPLVPQPGDLQQVGSASSDSLAGVVGLGGGCLVSWWDGQQSLMCSETHDGRAGWKRPQEVPNPSPTAASTRDQPEARSHGGAWGSGTGTSELCGGVLAPGWERRKHKALQHLFWPSLLWSPWVAEEPGPLLGCGSADKPGAGGVRRCLDLSEGGEAAGLCALARSLLGSRASLLGGRSSVPHLELPSAR